MVNCIFHLTTHVMNISAFHWHKHGQCDPKISNLNCFVEYRNPDKKAI